MEIIDNRKTDKKIYFKDLPLLSVFTGDGSCIYIKINTSSHESNAIDVNNKHFKNIGLLIECIPLRAKLIIE